MEQHISSYFSPELVDEVIERLQKLIEKSPNDPQHYRNFGNAYVKKSDFIHALAAFEKVISLSPSDTTAHLNAGKCAEAMNDFATAEANYKRAIFQKPEWPDLHFRLGHLYFNHGQIKEAKECVAEALVCSPNYRDAMHLFALIHEKEGNLAEALRYLKMIIALPVDSTKVNNPFPFDIEVILDDPIMLEEFIRQVERFLKTSDEYADLHFKLGMAYRRKGDKEKAMDEFKKVLQINPKFHLARHYYWSWDTSNVKKL
ncbi:MAG: tetratricopeptide repeat protein [Candidatus Riflebacteria bacterium]|nr:tetratricopeptide repeat protein [Candidatus Riflebacteria bacterium]